VKERAGSEGGLFQLERPRWTFLELGLIAISVALLIDGLPAVRVVSAIVLASLLLRPLLRGTVRLGPDRLVVSGFTRCSMLYRNVSGVRRLDQGSTALPWNRPDVEIRASKLCWLVVIGPPFLIPTGTVRLSLGEAQADSFIQQVTSRL
jgi:hypothetical protein